MKRLDLGKDDLEVRGKRFKGVQDVTYRINILDETNVVRAYVHYVNGLYLECIREASGDPCPACESANEQISRASERIATMIVVFGTDQYGQLLQPLSFNVMLWSFGPQVYRTLAGLKREWGGLSNHDLQLVCTNAKFQQWGITILPQSVLDLSPGLREKVIKSVNPALWDVGKQICRQYTADKMLAAISATERKVDVGRQGGRNAGFGPAVVGGQSHSQSEGSLFGQGMSLVKDLTDVAILGKTPPVEPATTAVFKAPVSDSLVPPITGKGNMPPAQIVIGAEKGDAVEPQNAKGVSPIPPVVLDKTPAQSVLQTQPSISSPKKGESGYGNELENLAAELAARMKKQ